jgi:hypothetical protein
VDRLAINAEDIGFPSCTLQYKPHFIHESLAVKSNGMVVGLIIIVEFKDSGKANCFNVFLSDLFIKSPPFFHTG